MTTVRRTLNGSPRDVLWQLSDPNLRVRGDVTWRFTITCGVLVYGEVVRRLRALLHRDGITYTVEEDKGWFESDARFTVRGPLDTTRNLLRDVTSYLEAADIALRD